MILFWIWNNSWHVTLLPSFFSHKANITLKLDYPCVKKVNPFFKLSDTKCFQFSYFLINVTLILFTWLRHIFCCSSFIYLIFHNKMLGKIITTSKYQTFKWFPRQVEMFELLVNCSVCNISYGYCYNPWLLGLSVGYVSIF